MKREPKIIIPSLLAPIVSLLIPVGLAVFTILTDLATQNDNAPVRAAGLLLVAVLPVSYFMLVLFMAAVGYLLGKIRKLSLRNLLLVDGLVCVPVAFLFGWSSPFGLRDQLIGLGIFFSMSVL